VYLAYVLAEMKQLVK